MALTNYNGMDNNMPQTFSSMLDRFFNESVNSRNISAFTPHVDTCETEKGYEIEVALPGVKKDDITIDYQEGRLSITGERKFERKEHSKRYQILETQYGTFTRTFQLPDNIKPENIKADMQDGILLISVPKDAKKTMKHQIKISSNSENKDSGKSKKVNVNSEDGKSVEA
jgi:HSP20 family protein